MGKKKILFIEDEPDLVMLLQMRLEMAGFEFISAVDGEEGLNKAYREKPDLIILDVVMPKIDGLEVCRRIRNNSETKNIPVIILSAFGGRDLEKRSLAAGADICIKKPYDSGDLIRKIKALLKKH